MQTPQILGLHTVQPTSLSLHQLLDYSISTLLTCVWLHTVGEGVLPYPFFLQHFSFQIWVHLFAPWPQFLSRFKKKVMTWKLIGLSSILRVCTCFYRLKKIVTSNVEPYFYIICIIYITEWPQAHTLPWVSSPQFRENEPNFLQDSHSFIACEAYTL